MSVTVNGKKYEVKTTKEGLTLDLGRRKITDISQIEGLSALTDLQILWLNANQISEIKGLDALTKLQSLDLSANKIREIKGLDALVNLVELNLIANQISEIKGLDALTKLQTLYLYRNQISEIKGLDALASLQKLYIFDNPITEWAYKEFGKNSNFPANVPFIKNPQAAVAYCQRQVAPLREAQRRKAEEQQAAEAQRQQQAAMEPARLEKLKKLVRVSKSLTVPQMAQILDLTEKELYERIVDWADQFGFTLDKDTVEFGAGHKDDFLAQLDKEFATWGKSPGGKV